MKRPSGINADLWVTAVKRGQELARGQSVAQWVAADIALELCPMRFARGTPTVHDILTSWLEASELEWKPTTLRLWRLVAQAWPPERRVKECSFMIHKELYLHPQRFELLKPGIKAKDAAKLVGPIRTRRKPRTHSTADYFDSIYRFWLVLQERVAEGISQDEMLEIGWRVDRIEQVRGEVLDALGMRIPELELAA